MQLISKKNGKNYYGIDSKGAIQEIVKMRGRFYKTKFILGEGFRPVGNPLKNFTLLK